MEDKIESILEKMYKNGSTFDVETLKGIKKSVENEIKKDQSAIECLKDLTQELEIYSSEFLHDSNQVISGLSSAIYLPNVDGTYSITIFGGKTSYDESGKEISEKTVFDLASITKLYTLVLTLKLIEIGYFKLTDKIRKLDSRFSNLEDYSVEDVLKMSGEIRTDGRVNEGKNKEEALQILRTSYIFNPDRTVNNYTDIGFLVLSKIIEKIISEDKKKECSFDEIMKEYLLEPWGITDTMFYADKEKYDIAGSGNKEGLVHDPKTRILGGATGSAGLFSNIEGIKTLSEKLFSVTNVNYTKLMGTIIYPNSNKGYAGIYQKHPLGLEKTFVPNDYSMGSFAHQGFTGATTIFDPNNRIMNAVLVNSIKDKEVTKPKGYIKAFTTYQIMLTTITLKTYLLNQYYKLIGYSEDIEIKGKTI